MKLSDFDYDLPAELIAKKPAQPRDHSKLLIIDRSSSDLSDDYFFNIDKYFKTGDVIILNNSKVFPARLIGKKQSGGSVEIFLNNQIGPNVWEALGRKVKVGQTIEFDDSDLKAKIIDKKDDTYSVELNMDGKALFSELERIGHIPLPPYINRTDKSSDRQNYQTVYAKERGSVAAPTAGLHFTDEVFQKLRVKGIEILEITLHVGLGTFSPVKTERIEDHKIHSEYYYVQKEVFEKIKSAKKDGRRIIAVGTTTTRVLEHLFSQSSISNPQPPSLIPQSLSGSTAIFIYPGYKFKCIDGLITNFHLPKSSLLMLISAFAGGEKIKNAYSYAISQKYRFYSYGDAMLIL